MDEDAAEWDRAPARDGADRVGGAWAGPFKGEPEAPASVRIADIVSRMRSACLACGGLARNAAPR